MVSTGNASLDQEVNAGGLFIGSLVVLLEDRTSQYYGHVHKTFLAEGVVREQVNMIIDPEPLRNKQWWLKFLPAVHHVKPSTTQPAASSSPNTTNSQEESKTPNSGNNDSQKPAQ